MLSGNHYDFNQENEMYLICSFEPLKAAWGISMENSRDIFKKGCVELVILSLLSEEDKYGRQLIMEIQERGQGGFEIQETSLYPTLYRLEDHGWISSKQQLVGKRRKRIYYHLEQAGAERLVSLKEHYYTIHNSVRIILENSGKQ